jgi:hypothetical protein
LLLGAWLTAGCGGGSSGGGSATVISGNVRSTATTAMTAPLERLWRMVRAWWASEAIAQVPGITVALVGSGISTTTDEQGAFELEANQFGPASVQFTGNGVDAILPLTLPAGGDLQLIDVDVTGTQVTVGQQLIQTSGPMTGIDCSAGLLQLLSGSQVAFRVRLSSSTSIVDQDGGSLSCVDLVIGRTAEVAGTVGENGEVTATSLVEDIPPSS